MGQRQRKAQKIKREHRKKEHKSHQSPPEAKRHSKMRPPHQLIRHVEDKLKDPSRQKNK
jgi:hypothetical protein